MRKILFAVILTLTFVVNPSFAVDVPGPSDKKVEYSPYPEKTFPNQVFFGDTHLHTSYSTDAGMIGNIVGPEDAYRLSRGEVITSSHGLKVKLSRPLDFVVISDHAENLGLAPAIVASDKDLLKNPWGKAIHDMVKEGKPVEAFDFWVKQINASEDMLKGSNFARSYWEKSTAAAEKYNEPGLFTAMIGFEWTSVPGGNNLHRNILFRDSKDKADQIIPISSYDTTDPEKLWDWMEAYEKKTGGHLLAIAHNGNISGGLMFDDVTLNTKEPLDRNYAQRRMRWEPVYEVTQIKGDGEAHPVLSPNDEFADFYTWDTGTFGPDPKTPDMLPKEYAREAFKRGLVYEEKLGVNPFKFGMIGSTDSHTSIPSTEEDNFFGKVSLAEPSANPHFRFDETIIGRELADKSKMIKHYRVASAGLAAVWSRENTRESLWDSFKRKEVYATTGTRIKVRLFAGWDYKAEDLNRSNFAEYGYNNGVPMGGDLTNAPKVKASKDSEGSDAPKTKVPTFLVRAVRDADGANLDRVQIIKGWSDKEGKTHEKIYDLAVSDDRKIGIDGRCKESVGNTVNVKDASYTNSIGEPYLQAFWKDPDFDPKQRSFYYVRVLEIPTPSWLAFDAKVYGSIIPNDGDTVIQERAYTSPIWYTP